MFSRLLGKLKHVHPLLNRDGGLALLVSGVALVLSAGFPPAIAFLSSQRQAAD